MLTDKEMILQELENFQRILYKSAFDFIRF